MLKNVRNFFRLRKETDDTAIKDIRIPFRLKPENEAIKNKVIRDIRNLFNHDEDFYKIFRVGNFWSNNYIEYETKRDKNKTLSFMIKNIINDLIKSDTWKIYLTIAINFLSSKDSDEVRVMHSKNDNIVIIINDKAYEAIENFPNHFFTGIKLGWKQQ